MDPVCELNVHRQIVSLLDKPNPVIFDIGCNDEAMLNAFCAFFRAPSSIALSQTPEPLHASRKNGFLSGSDEAIRGCDQRPKREDRVSSQQWQ